MKRYLVALILVGILIVVPVVGSNAQQANDPAEGKKSPEVNQMLEEKADEQLVIKERLVTFLVDAMQTSSTHYLNNMVGNEYITRDLMASAVMNILKNEGVNFKYLADEQFSQAEMLYRLGILPSIWDDLDAVVNKDEMNQIVNMLSAMQSTDGDRNAHGVTYALTSVDNNSYMFEMMWGRKPSSGYVIEIKDVVVEQGILYVSYTTHEPESGSAYLTVITNPRDVKTVDVGESVLKVVTTKVN